MYAEILKVVKDGFEIAHRRFVALQVASFSDARGEAWGSDPASSLASASFQPCDLKSITLGPSPTA